MLDETLTLEYIRRAKAGEEKAKERLIEENVSLVKCIVKRYLGKGVDYDDLFQIACMGFLKAIAGFDERYGVKFSTYAVPMIAGEIKRFMRDDGSVKVSRMMKHRRSWHPRAQNAARKARHEALRADCGGIP